MTYILITFYHLGLSLKFFSSMFHINFFLKDF